MPEHSSVPEGAIGAEPPRRMEAELFVDFGGPLRFSRGFLRVLGLWSRSPDSFFGRDLYTIYAVFILAALNLRYALEMVYWVLVPSDFATIASSAVVVFEELQTNVKVFCIIRYQPMVKRLLRECNKEMFQPRTRRHAEEAEAVLRVLRWFCWAYALSAVFGASSMSFNTLFGKQEQPTLPFVTWYPYNYSLHFWPTYGYQVVSYFVIAQTHVHIDSMAIGLMAIIVAQCGVLADAIRDLKATTRNSLEASGRKNLDQADLMLETEKRFYVCVQHHKEILRWFKEIYAMLDSLVLAQYASSAVTLCMALIQASLVDPSDPIFTAMGVYASVMLSQLFLYCWWGNEVISKSSQIPVAAFESDWPDMSPKAKKDLLTFMHCTQKPLELFGADYFSVSLQNYMLILRHSYSFFAVLRHMNSE